MRDKASAPAIAFGFRGENVDYRRHDQTLSVTFTWIGGPRLYPGSITGWSDGSPLTDEDRSSVFRDVLQFIALGGERSTVVINVDDPSRALWEDICSANAPLVNAVEYTSDDAEHAREREMYLSSLRAGKGLSVEGIEIKDEHDLDEVMKRRRQRSR
jgi:hypothetical protein